MGLISRRQLLEAGLVAGGEAALSRKSIVPFCSNGCGGLGQSVAAISKLAPKAHVGQGLSIYYSGGSDMPQRVSAWIASQS